MIAEVHKIGVRYVRREPAEEERLRCTVAELQATSILRAAGLARRLPHAPEAHAEPASAAGEERTREKAPAETAGANCEKGVG